MRTKALNVCLLIPALLTPARALAATQTQPERPQLQNTEPTQLLSRVQRVQPGLVPDGLSKGDWAGIKAFAPFEQQAYLKASNTDAEDRFGVLAISGDTLVVSAREERSSARGINGDQSDNSAFNAGAVYVFVRSGTKWSQQAYLKASNTDTWDFFGWSVAIDGDTLVVGAQGEASIAPGVNGDESDNSRENVGAAYVFTRSGTEWSQQAYLKPSNASRREFTFGYDVAISGDTVVVAAPTSEEIAGSAYVFTRSGTEWSQQAYLKGSNTESLDFFGQSVAIDGDTLVVGARGEASSAAGINGDQSNDSAPGAGAAYVFTRSGTVWSQQAYLKASNPGPGDNFGVSVALSDETLVVGAWAEDSDARGINGDQDNDSAPDAGAAYVFTRSGGVWSQQTYLKASNTGDSDFFGRWVRMFDDTLVVGANHEHSNATGVNGNQDDNSVPDAGAAYVFVNSGGVWSQKAYLKASSPGIDDRFGRSVDVFDDTIAVGAFLEDSNARGINGDPHDNSMPNAGAAYVFVPRGVTDPAGDAPAPIDSVLTDMTQDGDELTCTLGIASGSKGLKPRSSFQCHIGFGNLGFGANTTLTYLVKKGRNRCKGLPGLVCSEEELDAAGNVDSRCDGFVDGSSAAACLITLRGKVQDVSDRWLAACAANDCLTPLPAGGVLGDYDVYSYWSTQRRKKRDRIPDTDNNRKPDSLGEVVVVTLKN